MKYLELEIVIKEGTLLDALEPLVSEYTSALAAPVRIVATGNGPAADTGLFDVAVYITVGELLRRFVGDAYQLVREHIVALYPRIGSSPAHAYYLGRLALVVDDEMVTLRLLFPAGLSETELLARLRSVEDSWPQLVADWGDRVRGRRSEGEPGTPVVDLIMDVDTGEWVEGGKSIPSRIACWQAGDSHLPVV